MPKNSEEFDPKNPGWMNEEELKTLRAICSKKSDVLEIGCYCGRTTRALLESAQGLVIAIDPLHRNGWMPRWPDPGGVILDSHAYMASLVAEYPQRLVVFPVFSNEVFKLFRRSVDVLVIDADHSFASTMNEIDAFASLVNDTGWLVLDDFDLEPVRSAWEKSRFYRDRPWLHMGVKESLGICNIVQQPANNPPEILATPVPEKAP